jgi:hypothetical protein
VIRRFRYERRSKTERGVLFANMRRSSGYSRQHLSRGSSPSIAIPSRSIWRAVQAGPVFRANTMPRTSAYWPRPTVCTTPCRGRPPRSCCSVPTAFLGICAMRGSRSCPSPTSTTCAPAPRTANSACNGVERDPHRSLSAVAKPPAPQGLPGDIRIDIVHQGDQDGLKGTSIAESLTCKAAHADGRRC